MYSKGMDRSRVGLDDQIVEEEPGIVPESNPGLIPERPESEQPENSADGENEQDSSAYAKRE